ncbi:MAG: hypothetical protein ACSHYC_22425 [Alphaproteobacteria bacterium]
MLDLDLALSGQRTAIDPMMASFFDVHDPHIGSRRVKTASCANEGTVNA